MENPGTWGPAERAVAGAIGDWEQACLKGIIGPSLTRRITDALRKAGLLKEAPVTDTNYAVAPGEYLEEWIDAQGFSQQHVADLLGSSRKQVNEIVNGRAPVTSDTAVRLERVVGIPADAWLRYEAAYRADLARIADQVDANDDER